MSFHNSFNSNQMKESRTLTKMAGIMVEGRKLSREGVGLWIPLSLVRNLGN